LTNLGTSSTTDFFIAKYDSSGNVKWAKNAGGNDDDQPNSIATDLSGNVYVVGQYYSSTMHFGAVSFGNTGLYDMCFAKYDSSGM